MATFLNGSMPSLNDLKMYESGILDVASTEGIDLSEKADVARDEIAAELLLFLVKRQNALGWRGNPLLSVTRPKLEQVARTAPLRQWHILHTLAVVYRDAFFGQLNDRYQRKWQEYDRLAGRAQQITFDSGLGMITSPIPQAGAPVLSAGTGTLAAANYYVRVSWVDGTGTEGEASDVRALSLGGPGVLQVQAPLTVPAGVAGWNVYVGTSADALSLQNSTPLPLGQAWVLSGAGLQAGPAPGDGQAPDQYYYSLQQNRRG